MSTSQVVACTCGRRFRAGEQLVGKRVKCPGCGQAIDVPALGGSGLDLAAQAMRSMPVADPLLGSAPKPLGSAAAGRNLATAQPSSSGKVPLGVWIAAGLGGGLLVLVCAGLLTLRAIAQRIVAQTTAQAQQRQVAQSDTEASEAPAKILKLYQSPASQFTIEFPGPPKRELIRDTQSDPLMQSHWEASYEIGDFRRFRGEQFLVIEHPRIKKLTDAQMQARFTELVNVTAGIDEGKGRLLTSVDVSQPGCRGREVTYEMTPQSGRGRVSGRFRVIIVEHSLGSDLVTIEWVAAPAKAETDDVRRFFDSFQVKKAD